MPHRLAIVIAVLLASLAPAGAAFGASAGGGAELPARAYQYWCAHGADCTYDVHDADLDAGALGSGEVQWIGVDEPLDAAQKRAAGGPLQHVPVMLAAIAVSVNIPGVSGHHVDLTGRTLAHLSELCRMRGAESVRTAVLIHRRIPESVFTPDHAAFGYDGREWFTGYGMDDRSWRTNYPSVYILKGSG